MKIQIEVCAATVLCLAANTTAWAALQVLDQGGWQLKHKAAIIGNSGHVLISRYQSGSPHFLFWNGTELVPMAGAGWWEDDYKTGSRTASMGNQDHTGYMANYVHYLQDMNGNVRTIHRDPPPDLPDAYYMDLGFAINNNGAYVRSEYQRWDCCGNGRGYTGNFYSTTDTETKIYENMSNKYDPDKPRLGSVDINDSGSLARTGKHASLGIFKQGDDTIPDATNNLGVLGYNGKFKLLNSGRFVYDGSPEDVVDHELDLMLSKSTVVVHLDRKNFWDASRGGNIAYIKNNAVYAVIHGVTHEVTGGAYGRPTYVSINDGGSVVFVTWFDSQDYTQVVLWHPDTPVAPKLVYNGQFAGTNLLGWDVAGSGSAAAGPAPGTEWGADGVVSLNTTSRVSLSQPISTPGAAFELSFDYQFTTTNGTLTVTLGSSEIATLMAPTNLLGLPLHSVATLTDPALSRASDLVLSLSLDAPADANLLLDNIAITPLDLPKLSLSMTGNLLELSWAEQFSNWRLQSAANPTTSGWTDLVGDPTVGSGHWTLTITNEGGGRFFRLVKPN